MIYEHPIPGLILIRFQYYFSFYCHERNVDTISHLLALCYTTPTRTYSATTWSHTIASFRSLNFFYLTEFTLHFLSHPTPSTLLDHTSKNLIHNLTQAIHDLNNRLDKLQMEELKVMREVNLRRRTHLGTTTPIPTDFRNTIIEKTPSTIEDYTKRVTKDLRFQKKYILRGLLQDSPLSQSTK